MKFGRLEGFVTMKPNETRWLTVILDTGSEVVTIRDEEAPEGFDDRAPEWLADQLVQETLGIDLAEQGWELVGEAHQQADADAGTEDIARSPIYVIRQV